MKFGLYRVVSGVLQVFAWIILVVSVIMAIVVVATPGYHWNYYYYNMPMGAENILGMRWLGFLIFLLIGIVSWAFLLAIAGILSVLISIDQNLSPRYGPSQPISPQYGPSQPIPAPGAVCPNCGAKVKPGDRFCQSCGAKLE